MKKTITFLLIAVIVPQTAMAAWWNPFSWSIFHKTAPPVQVPAMTLATSTATTTNKTTFTAVKENKVSMPTPSSSPVDIQKWLGIIDSTIKNYQGQVATLNSNIANASNLKKQLEPKLTNNDAASSLLFATTLMITGMDQQLVDKLNSKIAELKLAQTKIKSTNYVDLSVWNSTKQKELANFSADMINQGTAVVNKYDADMALIAQGLQLSNTLNNMSSLPSSPPQQYIAPVSSSNGQAAKEAICGAVDGQVRQEISSGGGMANEAQIDALVYQKKQQLGCYDGSIPTAECSDFTLSYSSNWSGTCSDHGGIYIKF